ncbi:MAG: hypothetical protein ABEJ61_10535 [Haloferacaceae archaeon]
MAQTALVVSFLFGVALVATVAFVARREWRGYTPAVGAGADGGVSAVVRAANGPTAWSLAFLVAALGGVGATVLFVGGATGALKRGAGIALAGGAAVVLVGYLFYGTVVSARGRGLANAQAVALGSWALGLLGIAVITIKLLGVV